MADLKVVAKARLFSTIEVRNVFYCDVDLVSAPEKTDVLSDLGDWVHSVYQGLYTFTVSAFSLYEADVYIWNTSEWIPYGSVPLTFTGFESGDGLPSQMAAVAIGRTIVKRVFARKFFAGISESANLNGSLVSGAVIALGTALAAWITPFTGDATGLTFTPGTWTQANASASFITGIADAIMGTMRRRKLGVGI
jgi:hypothetical protein